MDTITPAQWVPLLSFCLFGNVMLTPVCTGIRPTPLNAITPVLINGHHHPSSCHPWWVLCQSPRPSTAMPTLLSSDQPTLRGPHANQPQRVLNQFRWARPSQTPTWSQQWESRSLIRTPLAGPPRGTLAVDSVVSLHPWQPPLVPAASEPPSQPPPGHS